MAANKLFAEVVIAGSYKGLSKSTRGASAEMNTLAGKTKATSKLMKTAIAGISFVAIAQQLISAAKAADEDRRSMALLNRTLDVSWKANDKTKQTVDDFITSMSMMSGIVDDDLRPAYAKIAQQTKSVTKANKMFSLAMDISADKGIALDVAARAVTKAMAGNQNAFNKLYPAAKKSGDAIGYVTKKAKGAAKISGDNSPFARMTVQFDELKEKIGKELLPYVDDLANWMNSKDGQKTIKETTKALVDLVREAGKLAKWAIDNKEVVIGIAVALKGWQISNGVISSWKALSGIWKGMKAPKPALPGAGATLPGAAAPAAGGAATGTGTATGANAAKGAAALSAPVAVAASATAAVAVYGASMVELYNKDQKKYTKEVKRQVDRAREYSSNGYYSATELMTGGANSTSRSAAVDPGAGGGNMSSVGLTKPAVINVTVNGVVSGNDVVTALTKYARGKGVPMSKLLK